MPYGKALGNQTMPRAMWLLVHKCVGYTLVIQLL